MNLLAISIVLLSTFMHASWNLLARYTRSEQLFFEKMQISITVLGFIPAVLSELIARSIPTKVWFYLLLSGTSCCLYYFALANSYRSSDFTTVYPVARAMPVVLMGLIDLIRGRRPSSLAWLGIILVTIGCALSPLSSFRNIKLEKYLNWASIWMTLTAVGTVGYSTFDKMSSETISPGVWSAARYGYFFYALSGMLYTIVRRSFIRKRESKQMGWLLPTLGGILNFSAYWLILWAYQMVGKASYVVAFRQFSIVIGSITAFLIYRESGVFVRMLAVSMITFGLIIIALWGK